MHFRRDAMVRHWVVEMQYPGRTSFYYGTISVRDGATHRDVETAALQSFAEHIPSDWPMPEITKLMKGHINFVSADDEHL